MSVELVQSIDSSKVFAGTSENFSVYENRVVIYIPNQQGPNTEELYYSQISGVPLFTGLLYATLSELAAWAGVAFWSVTSPGKGVVWRVTQPEDVPSGRCVEWSGRSIISSRTPLLRPPEKTLRCRA